MRQKKSIDDVAIHFIRDDETDDSDALDYGSDILADEKGPAMVEEYEKEPLVIISCNS